MNNRKQRLLENGIYLIIWIIVLAVPFFAYNGEKSLRWQELCRFWSKLIPFVALFLINNYLLLPHLLTRKKYIAYIITVFCLIGLLFTAIPIITKDSRTPYPTENNRNFYHKGDTNIFRRHPFPQGNSGRHDKIETDTLFFGFSSETVHPPHEPRKELRPPRNPLPVKWGPMLGNWLLAILLIGFNAAVKLIFKSFRDERQLKELEKQNLQAELNYLKAQVNPHFFMNTLNNIHALIDIDADKAKMTVIELSKIMRYVLYDTDKEFVPLQKEIDFLDNYVSLMSIRYPEDIDIRTIYPDSIPDLTVPPLLLVSLIENAFKHGISYQQNSYIHAQLALRDGRLSYTVKNSLPPNGNDKPGVGLENLRKRLTLLYGGNFSLDTSSQSGEYVVKLLIPLKK